ncbi:unnamed protein product [Callosobruchus maculatus]|uniref:Uncharacterized protein n=1 Tax=Callosobruchus maculatus TaxID=64391 RepID=A0A653DE69_CALMS|nr:unnamed protein product [Callosobruchus maculatus]
MLIRWKNKDKDKEKCEKGTEEEWNSDSKSGRGNDSDTLLAPYSSPTQHSSLKIHSEHKKYQKQESFLIF